MATLAPSAARRFAIAAPIPREPPVTTATLPANFCPLLLLMCFVPFCPVLFSWAWNLRFSSEAGVVIEFNGVEPCLDVFASLAEFPDVFGKPGETLSIAVGPPLFHVSRPGFDLPRRSRSFGVGLDPSEDFPVALSRGQLLQKGFGIETEKLDKVLVSRRIVVVLSILLHEGRPALVKHARQDDEAAE